MFNKKMILMLVLLTTLVAGAAMAGGNYKIYGKLHTSVDMVNDSENSQISLASNTSRFGVKGAQELNENFTFIWQFEQMLNIAKYGEVKEGDKYALANRNTFLGLKGDWGQVRFGIHDTPFKTLGRKATFFFDEIGDHRTTTMGWDRRMEEIAAYVSPDFNGFSFFALYQMDQAPLGAAEAKSAFSANAMYNKDGIMIGAAIENLSKGHAYNEVDDVYGESQMGMRFAGKYTVEQFAISALYQNLTDVGGVADAEATTIGFEGKFQFDPKFAFKVGYYMADPKLEDDADTADIDESKSAFSQLALGVDHTYAKNLSFYIQYAMVMNDDAAMKGLAGGWHGTTVGASGPGESPNGFSVGSWFKF